MENAVQEKVLITGVLNKLFYVPMLRWQVRVTGQVAKGTSELIKHPEALVTYISSPWTRGCTSTPAYRSNTNILMGLSEVGRIAVSAEQMQHIRKVYHVYERVRVSMNYMPGVNLLSS